MQTEKFTQKMNDGTEVAVNRWLPDDADQAKAVIVLSHGMLEHSLRYDRVGSIFAEEGFIFQGHDHRAHGKTALLAEQNGTGGFGIFPRKEGFNKVVSDLSEVIARAKKDFPGKKIILLGHSFGSFVSQCFIENQKDVINGVILCGTAGPMKLTSFAGHALFNLYCIFNKPETKSKTMQNIAFGSYFAHIKKSENGVEWLSKSVQNQEMYLADSWCGGIASAGFFKELTGALTRIHKSSNIKRIDPKLPVLFIAGTEDPVGNFTKSIRKLAAIYRKNGAKSVQEIYYQDDRHEIFNEDDSEKVIQNVKDWIKTSIL